MCCCYLQVVSLSISFTVDEMVHLVINCVQKTKNISNSNSNSFINKTIAALRLNYGLFTYNNNHKNI